MAAIGIERVAHAGREAEERWAALVSRDACHDGRFVYGVRTTGVYCRPHCASRVPLRRNVEFFGTAEAAERAGYRACLRCAPGSVGALETGLRRIVEVCRWIESAPCAPRSMDLARRARMDVSALRREFRGRLGVSPREYAGACRIGRLRAALRRQASVSSAILEAGYGSSARCYAESSAVLGMTPREYRGLGEGVTIRYGTVACSLGGVLVAETAVGVCRVAVVEGAACAVEGLAAEFPGAEIHVGAARFLGRIRDCVGHADATEFCSDMPRDIRERAFGRRVWRRLAEHRTAGDDP